MRYHFSRNCAGGRVDAGDGDPLAGADAFGGVVDVFDGEVGIGIRAVDDQFVALQHLGVDQPFGGGRRGERFAFVEDGDGDFVQIAAEAGVDRLQCGEAVDRRRDDGGEPGVVAGVGAGEEGVVGGVVGSVVRRAGRGIDGGPALDAGTVVLFGEFVGDVVVETEDGFGDGGVRQRRWRIVGG